jgi:CRP-like cAMP-binding protein
MAEPKLLDAWADLFLTERQEHFGLLIDLGSRSADERIAHLVLHLRSRLERRGMVRESAFSFPLTQRQIANATGLSPEHVNRVMGAFRRTGLIETQDRSLEIIDLAGLERIGRLNF